MTSSTGADPVVAEMHEPVGMRVRIVRLLNALAVVGLSLVLLGAYVLQFSLGELPCPLCMLQRIAFALVVTGFVMNLRFGARPLHYAMVLVSAGYGLMVSGRQVLLHIVPGSGAYGTAVLSLHLYTWAAILFAATVAGTALLLALHTPTCEAPPPRRCWVDALCWVAAGLVFLNAVTSFAQCGPIECGDNPVSWWIFSIFR